MLNFVFLPDLFKIYGLWWLSISLRANETDVQRKTGTDGILIVIISRVDIWR